MLGIAALLLAAAIAEAFPLPIQGIPIGATSLASLFVVGTGALYGWEAATVVAFAVQLLVEPIRRQPLIRLAYNAAVYSLAGAAAGATAAALDDTVVGSRARRDRRLLRRRPLPDRARRRARRGRALPPAARQDDPRRPRSCW